MASANQPRTVSSQAPTESEGYGQFRVNLGSLLTRSHATMLATWFGYSPANIDKIINSDCPSHEFVQLMDERGEISPSDISKLTEALEHNTIGLGGLAVRVKEAFYQQVHSKAKEEFLRELRKKYETLYNGIQPIPFIRDKLYGVDKVFVEAGIEYVTVSDGKKGGKTWTALGSYKDMFNDMGMESVRRILEGDPGFGKSTVTLQVAYDWCNGTAGSVSDKYEILILLRLNQMGGVRSIYEAIRKLILPKDSNLNVADITHILKETKSVLVILDGFDEYPDRNGDDTYDVLSIIKMDMCQTFTVVLTTRTGCLPKQPAPQTERIRLTGFNDLARDEYIRKAVVDDDKEVEIIKSRLQKNPILADLCQMPLMFVMYAHISHDRKDLGEINSVTSFFRYLIWCFHDHMRNKPKDGNVEKFPVFADNHHELDKVAFEGLCRKDQQLLWDKQDLCERLGQAFYDYYVRLGILVEEDVLDIKSKSDIVREKTEVRFYHKLFCEWYAAHYLSSCAGKGNVKVMSTEGWHTLLVSNFWNLKDISDLLKDLDPFGLQYVFRFACGLNSEAAVKIIEYLKKKDNAPKFAVLCILEKEGNIEAILESVRDLCSKIVEIKTDDTLLLQRSTIQLLEIASTNEILISGVSLIRCYSTIDPHGGNHLRLRGNISMPVFTTVKELAIYEKGREITAAEFIDILQYASKCLALQVLGFYQCLLPFSVQSESVSDLKSRKAKVNWGLDEVWTWYKLDLESCLWKDVYYGNDLTEEEYQRKAGKFREGYNSQRLHPRQRNRTSLPPCD